MQSATRSLFGRSAALFAATSAVGAAALFSLGSGARAGAAAGLIASALGSAVALALLAAAFDRGLKPVLAALVVGFLTRMLLVAAGLLASGALGGDPLAFTAAFFGLYLAHQAIELTVVVRRARAVSAEGSA